MYHYVYKITNLLDGRIYIGIHSTDNLEDKYMGSSIPLYKDIKKFGIENFKKEILEFCPNRDVLLNREKELVDDNFVKRKDTYNINLGGCTTTTGLVPVRDKGGQTFMTRVDDPRYISGELVHVIKGIKYNFSEKELKRRSEHGKTNARRRKVTNGIENKFIFVDELDDFLKTHPDWHRGETQHWSKESIYNSTRSGKHKQRIENAKIKREWLLEERKNHVRKKIPIGIYRWVTNGDNNQKIKKTNIDKFLADNPTYRLGMTHNFTDNGRKAISAAGHRCKGKTNVIIEGKRTKVFTKDLYKYPNASIGWWKNNYLLREV